jgi:membrane glycosyltransferase
LHPVSRFHLLHGSVSYLLSPAWFILLVIWFFLGKDDETNIVRYFNEANPLFPDWPPAMSHIDSAIFLLIMYAILLTPKIIGAAIISLHPKATKLYGGRTAFLGAFCVELVVSVAYAPVVMIQQCKAVLRAAVGRPTNWRPQNRQGHGYPLGVLLRFHWLETVLGLVLVAGLSSGLVSLWLIPIAASLILAIPLSALSAAQVNRCLPAALRMNSPHSLREPYILKRAKIARSALRNLTEAPQFPAE